MEKRKQMNNKKKTWDEKTNKQTDEHADRQTN